MAFVSLAKRLAYFARTYLIYVFNVMLDILDYHSTIVVSHNVLQASINPSLLSNVFDVIQVAYLASQSRSAPLAIPLHLPILCIWALALESALLDTTSIQQLANVCPALFVLHVQALDTIVQAVVLFHTL